MRTQPAFLLVVAVTIGCDSSAPEEDGEFVLKGSPTARPAASPPSRGLPPQLVTPIATPSSMVIRLFDLYLSPNEDCSGTITVSSSGTSVPKDLVTSPTMFVGTAPVGLYNCLVIKMVDIIDFTSPVTAGPCAAGPVLQKDIYRIPETDFRDLSLSPIVATGTTATPGPDNVFLLFSINPAAAIARGFSSNQTYPLTKGIVVPTTATFYWDVTSIVVDDAGACSLEPPTPIVG